MPHLLPRRAGFLTLCAVLGLAAPARADDPTPIEVALKDHRFQPAEIHVRTGQRAVLIVRNEDATADEFDSVALHVEKVIAPGTYARIWLHPLGPGRYPFMGEFHPDTAQGVVISE
jgi:hypothetical protein